MNYKELIEALKSTLPQKVPYGELVGAEGAFAHSGPMVYEDPEPYFVEQAITAITDLLSRAESAESAQETLQRAVAEYKARAEKAEERARKAEEEINKNSACWMCVKNEDCHKGWAVKEPDCKCGSFVWRGQKE